MKEYSIFYEQWKEARNMIIFFSFPRQGGKINWKEKFCSGRCFRTFVYFFPSPPKTGGGEGMGSNHFHNL